MKRHSEMSVAELEQKVKELDDEMALDDDEHSEDEQVTLDLIEDTKK